MVHTLVYVSLAYFLLTAAVVYAAVKILSKSSEAYFNACFDKIEEVSKYQVSMDQRLRTLESLMVKELTDPSSSLLEELLSNADEEEDTERDT